MRDANADVLPIQFAAVSDTMSGYVQQMHRMADDKRKSAEAYDDVSIGNTASTVAQRKELNSLLLGLEQTLMADQGLTRLTHACSITTATRMALPRWIDSPQNILGRELIQRSRRQSNCNV